MKQATNPESGTINYTYDANSNLKSKVDARNIKTIYDYDALNRVFKRCYRVISGPLGATSCADAGGGYTYQNAAQSRQTPKKVKIKPISKTYDVTGKTAREAGLDAINKGKNGATRKGGVGETYPLDIGQDFESSDFRPSATINKATGECTFSLEVLNVQISFEIETTLPNWVNKGDAPESEQKKWNEAYVQLEAHEGEHASDIQTRLEEYRDGIIGLKARGTGKTLEDARNNAFQNLGKQITALRVTMVANMDSDGDARDKRGNTFVIK